MCSISSKTGCRAAILQSDMIRRNTSPKQGQLACSSDICIGGSPQSKMHSPCFCVFFLLSFTSGQQRETPLFASIGNGDQVIGRFRDAGPRLLHNGPSQKYDISIAQPFHMPAAVNFARRRSCGRNQRLMTFHRLVALLGHGGLLCLHWPFRSRRFPTGRAWSWFCGVCERSDTARGM